MLAFLLICPPCLCQTLAFGETNPQFGTVAVGEKSNPKIISIVNKSSAPIFLRQISVSEDFTEANECPIWLPEGDGCRVYISFSPSKAGLATGKMYVDWTGKGEQEIPLMGFGRSAQESDSPSDKKVQEGRTRTTNDEEKADELIRERMSHSTPESTKKYIYSAFQSKEPAIITADEQIFALTRDSDWKERMAAILVNSGVSDPMYLNYLQTQAEKALAHDRDIPMVYSYDENRMPKATNPALIEWCLRNRIDTSDAFEITYFQINSPWDALAAAQDPRNYDLLVKGLHSANILIPEIAAGGLALLQDPRAIPELISAGRRVPADGLGGIVEALLCFSSTEAQAAAWEIIPDSEKAKEKPWFDGARELIGKEGPHAYFGWGG
jgi:hypothetical protein